MCRGDMRIILNDDFITPKLSQKINITLAINIRNKAAELKR